MTLEQQVTSLELSQTLKELGVPQRSCFGWQKEGEEYRLHYFEDLNGYRDLAAFTVAELGALFPVGHVYHTRIMETNLGPRRHDLTYQKLSGSQPIGNVWLGTAVADTEVNARAKMLIYLIQNKLITL